ALYCITPKIMGKNSGPIPTTGTSLGTGSHSAFRSHGVFGYVALIYRLSACAEPFVAEGPLLDHQQPVTSEIRLGPWKRPSLGLMMHLGRARKRCSIPFRSLIFGVTITSRMEGEVERPRAILDTRHVY